MKFAVSMDTRVIAALVGFGVLAGGSFMFTKVLVGELTTLQLVAARTAVAAVGVGGLMLVMKTQVQRTRRYLGIVVVLSMLDSIVPYLLIAWAQIHVTSSTTALLVGTMPIFTTLFACLNSESKTISVAVMAGLASAFLGAAVLAGPSALDVGNSGSLGMLAIIASAACYAAATVLARSVLRSVSAVALTGDKLVFAAVVVAPLALTMDGAGAYGSMSAEGVLSLLLLGLGSTSLGRCVYFWALSKAGSVKASMVTYIAPIVAIVLGWLVLGEAMDARVAVGAALIIAGVAGAMFGPSLAGRWRRVSEAEPAVVAVRAG